MLQIIMHPSVLSVVDDSVLASCASGTSPVGPHRAHGNGCIFDKSPDQLRLCAFGTNLDDHPCSVCESWSANERKYYRQSLREFGVAARIDKPTCWSSVIDAVFASDDAYSDLLFERLDAQSQLSPLHIPPRSPLSRDRNRSEDILQQIQSPQLLQTLRALQDPGFQAAVKGLAQSASSKHAVAESVAGSTSEEDHVSSRLELIHWARKINPEMIHTAMSVAPGSFAFNQLSTESLKLKGDEGVMTAFIKGLNIHKKVPESAQSPAGVLEALQSSSASAPSSRRIPYPAEFRPVRPSYFHFGDVSLQSYLSQEALNPNVSPHPDWGSSRIPNPSSQQWNRTADGLKLHLEAAALVDLLAKSEDVQMDNQRYQMFRNLRQTITSSAMILGSFGHDALLARREQVLEKFRLPNKAFRLSEPFLPNNLLGPQTSKDLQTQRNPVDNLSYWVTEMAKERRSTNQHKADQGNVFRSSKQRGSGSRYNPYRNQLSAYRGRNTRGRSPGRGRGRGSSQQPTQSSGAQPSKKRF